VKISKLLNLFVITVMVSVGAASSVSASSASSKVILGYYTPDQESYNALTSYYSSFTQMSTDTFNFDKKGGIVGTAPTNAINFAKSKNITTYACISNFGVSDFDPALAHAVLSSSTVKKKAIANLVALVKNNGYKGVNVDIESVPKTDRNALSNFIRDLANILRPQGFKTLISVPAKTVDDPNDDWSGAFDYTSLGKNVDFVQVMTYDQNGPWSSPGPVAGKDWMEQSLQFAVSTVPAAKVLMGLPAYGYDWNLTTNNANDDKQIPWKDIPTLISNTKAVPQWDTATSSPYFTYKAGDGSNHVVWYENAKSIKEKTHFTVSYNLGGVSMWAIGLEDGTFWKSVQAGLQ
jgi:spore germination protein